MLHSLSPFSKLKNGFCTGQCDDIEQFVQDLGVCYGMSLRTAWDETSAPFIIIMIMFN